MAPSAEAVAAVVREIYSRKTTNTLKKYLQEIAVELPTAAKATTSLEDLRNLAVGAVVRGVTVSALDQTAPTLGIVRDEELHAKLDKISDALQKIATLERSV